METRSAETSTVTPGDRNRAARLTAIRELDRLLSLATDPEFRGTVVVEVSSKAGRLAGPKTTIVQFGRS